VFVDDRGGTDAWRVIEQLAARDERVRGLQLARNYGQHNVLLCWGTSRFSVVEVRQDPRYAGDSGYSVRRLLAHAMNMMTGFSVLPLQIASMLGLLFGFCGFLVLAYVVGRYLVQGSSVPGFSFLASIIAIFSGVQLLALGIFGEYLARMHFRSMDRPPYALAQHTAKRASALTA
jgi:hypothetical protein